ncbi:MAG: hypothetical protein AAF666_00310 [Pseudomonadota bacterium]
MLFRSLGREKGLIWAVIAGYLLLPESFEIDLPGLPPYDKYFAVSLGICLAAPLFWHKKSWPDDPDFVEEGKFLRYVLGALILMILIQIVMTVQNNTYQLFFSGTRFDRVRQALSNRDMISMFASYFTAMVPFFMAWRLLRSPRHHRYVLLVMVITGSIYAVLAFWEMRFSPRMNINVYGYFQHDWRQHIRGGQFRPVVFLQHGLWLAFFLLTTALAAFALVKEETKGSRKFAALMAALWITGVLLLSPNLGVALLLVLFLPILFVARTIQVRVVWVVTLLFLAFPAVRQADLLPLDGFLGLISKISEERAASLQFRFDNEDDLIARAAEKPFFGWGGWARSRIIDYRGISTTVSDGLWIIILGERGWIGYLAYFGLLTVPLLLLGWTSRRRTLPHTTSAMGLIMAANLIYLVPNSTLNPIGWMLSGAIAGFIAWNEVRSPASEAAGEAPPDPRRVSYTRFANDKRREEAVPVRRSYPQTRRPAE